MLASPRPSAPGPERGTPFKINQRLENAAGSHSTLFPGEGEERLVDLIAWAKKTTDGSLSDLPVPPGEELWDEVAAEPDLCQRLKCPYFEKCFVFAARRKAAQADVIVVNHHLLLSDIAVRRITQNWDDAAVLPPYTRIILEFDPNSPDGRGMYGFAHFGRPVMAAIEAHYVLEIQSLPNAFVFAPRSAGSKVDLIRGY